MPSSRAIIPLTAGSALLTACASSPTAVDAIRLRLLEITQSAPADAPVLFVKGEVVNASTEPMEGGGCERPDMAVDSLGVRGWVQLPVRQSAKPILCIRAYTVDPGQTSLFQTWFQRSDGSPFPRGVQLRLRVLQQGTVTGPTREFTL